MFGRKDKQEKQGKQAQKITIDELREKVIAALKTIYDPEIPVNIYELGLIYDVDINDEHDVAIKMTLTTPGCPVAQTFPMTVEQTIAILGDVNSCTVELVWDPPWTIDRMSEAAKLELGMY